MTVPGAVVPASTFMGSGLSDNAGPDVPVTEKLTVVLV
jgi:hypothetical protein